MPKDKNGVPFILYSDSFEIIKKLSIEQRGILITAIFNHVRGDELIELDAMTDIVYTSIILNVDKNIHKYIEKCEIGRKNANARWHKDINQNVDECNGIQPNTTECNGINLHYINNDKNKNINNDDNNILDSIETVTKKNKKSFTPPTLEEVKNYISSKGYSVDAQMFFDYYDANNWCDREGRPVKSWKQKIITWSGNNKKNNKSKSEVSINAEQRRDYISFEDMFRDNK